MKEKKIGIFTLAVSLILLGGIFLLNNFIDINVYHILSIAWPVFIILLGLEIVFSRILFGNQEGRISISGKSVFFIILIVCITCVFSAFQRFPLYIDIGGDFLPIAYKNETTVNKDMTIETKGKKKLKIINGFGDVNVKKGDIKDIKVDIMVSMKHNYEEEEAQKIASNMLEVINDSGDTIKMINKRDKYTANNEVNNLEVNLDITIPYDMELDITNKYGEIMVNDCSNLAVISNKHGNIFIDTIKGDVDIKNSYGEVEIKNIDGNVNVENKHGKVFANNVTKDMDIDVEYGKIKVSEIGGNVEITNVNETIEAEKIGKNLTIESRYCRIDIDGIKGDLNINGKHGNILGKKIDGGVKVINEYGSIKVTETNKAIDIRNKHGQVIFESDKVISEKLEIENQYDRIDIRLPNNQEGKFHVYSKHGRIGSDFDLNIDKDNSEEIINQSIGNKSVSIDIKATNGDIRIDN
jgi:hypothetical protein